MLCNCNYNKTKVLYQIMKTANFIEKHCIRDAEKDGHPLCAEEFKAIRHELESHIWKLRDAIAGLSKEDKFG